MQKGLSASLKFRKFVRKRTQTVQKANILADFSNNGADIVSRTSRMVHYFIVDGIPSVHRHCNACFIVFVDFETRITQHHTLPKPCLINISCTFKKHPRLEGSSIVWME